MIMAVTDRPLTKQEQSALEEAFNLQRRLATLSQWVNEGYITVEKIDGLNDYRVECAGSVFREPTRRFPSEALIAKIGLAVNSGAVSDEQRMQNRAQTLKHHIHNYAAAQRFEFDKAWVTDEFCEIKEDVYKQVAELTRSVGRGRRNIKE